MIKNISTETLPLTWNMNQIALGPQETMSAMAFGLTDKKEVFAVEDRLLSKWKDRLERVPDEEKPDDCVRQAAGESIVNAPEEHCQEPVESTKKPTEKPKKKAKK